MNALDLYIGRFGLLTVKRGSDTKIEIWGKICSGFMLGHVMDTTIAYLQGHKVKTETFPSRDILSISYRI